MANSIINNSKITIMGLPLFYNTNAFLRAVNRTFQSDFGTGNQKIGNTLNIRLPNDPQVYDGTDLQAQGIVERSIPLVVNKRKNIPLYFSSEERTLNVNMFRERYIAPSINNLAGTVAADLMSMTLGAANMVANFDEDGNTIAPTSSTIMEANQILTNYSAPGTGRHAIIDPGMNASTVIGMSGLFNPVPQISRQVLEGKMSSQMLGINSWSQDQTVIISTRGTYDSKATATGSSPVQTVTGIPVTISGEQSPNSSVISVSAINGTLNAGDVVTFAGVYGVNRVTKQSTGKLAQFTVVADVASGGTSIQISPAMIGPDTTGIATNGVSFQTVSSLPTSSTVMTMFGKPGETYKRNFIFHTEAMQFAMVPLFDEMSKGVIDVGSHSFDGASMRTVTAYNIMGDQLITRLDVLYGYAMVRPEWVVVVCSPVD